MPTANADRNLLFGILAVQMDFISRDALIAAMNAWVLDKTQALGAILLQQGALRSDTHALLEALVAKHLEVHSNDPEKSLAAVNPAGSLRQDLQQVADADLQASLARVPATPVADDPYATRPSGAASQPGPLAPAVDPYRTRASEAAPSTSSAPRFRILRPHAQGGLGQVSVALDEELHREVALKEIQERHADHPDSRARFVLEAEITGGLEHPGIVPVYSLGQYADGRPFYAMRFIRGDSLKNAIERFHRADGADHRPGERTLELRQLLGRFLDVCQAIAYAHSRGVLHRDLKPGNIMLGQYGETLVVDWGLAKPLARPEAVTSPSATAEGPLQPVAATGFALTQMGSAIGTPQYMSPEQAAGRLDLMGPASDVYSLGATLYCLLTGRAPFREDDLGLLLQKVQKGDLPRPRLLNPAVSPALEAICLQAMALAPEARYPSPAALAEDLEHWLADEPVAAYHEPLFARLGRWARRHRTAVTGTVALLVTAVTALAISTVLIGREQQNAVNALKREQDARKERALAQVNALLDANPQAVRTLIAGLEAIREDVLPRLRELWDQEDRPEHRARRMRAGLALLPVDASLVKDALFAWMLQVDDPQEFLLLRDALRPHQADYREVLWQKAEAAQTPAGERFRALVVLAAFDGANAQRWKDAGPRVVEQFLTANPLHLGAWTDALRPVRLALLSPLGKAFRQGEPPERRQVAATVLADYAADRPDDLADLMADADARQFAVLLPKLRAHREKAIARLNQELARIPQPDWNDPPLDPAWVAPDPALVRQIEQGQGLLTECFALCQTMPLKDFPKVAEGLRRSGYRPIRFRPYAVAASSLLADSPKPASRLLAATRQLLVAAVWTRDGREWQLAQGLSAEDIRQRDADWRTKGLLAVDVAGYEVDGPGKDPAVHYAGLWVQPSAAAEETRVYLGVCYDGHKAATDPFKAQGFVPRTLQTVSGPRRQPHYSGVWGKGPATPERWNVSWNLAEAAYRDRLPMDKIGIDLDLSPAPPVVPSVTRLADQLIRAEKDVRAKPNDLEILFRRAQAYYQLGQDDRALADLDTLVTKAPKDAVLYHYRALVHARLGHAAPARHDLAEFQKRSDQAGTKACVDAIVAAYLGDDAVGLKRLEAALADHAKEPGFLYDAACAYAVAGRAARDKALALVIGTLPRSPSSWGMLPFLQLHLRGRTREQLDKAQRYGDRAVALLQQAVAAGNRNYEQMQTHTDLDGVRGHPGFAAVLGPGHLERRYAAVWHESAALVSAESHGLDPAQHLARCRELAAQGYRPAALSVAGLGEGNALVTASVWHRPVVADAAKDALTKRQAQAAVALLQLGEAESVWPLLKHGDDDPRRRTWLIHRLGPLATDPDLLRHRLETEPDVSARRALILSLGQFPAERVPAEVRSLLVERLLRWYGHDPDPGIHSAIDWLLRYGQEGEVPRPLEWQQGDALQRFDRDLKGQPPDGQRRWYVNGQGQTLAIIPGPVEFLMGSPASEPDRLADEALHREPIDRSFALATKPVTVRQFQEFRKAHPEVKHFYTERSSPDLDGPIVSVTWYEALQYCRWLSEQEKVPAEQMCYPAVVEIEKCKDGKTPLKLPADYLARTGYRLPTEAEWEYACRAGAATSRYYGSSEELLGRYAWYIKNSNDRAWPMGQKKPNDLGLFEMHGGVWQWCQDQYGQDRRALRGGSWNNHARNCRAAPRGRDAPGFRDDTFGFRVACSSAPRIP
jgi:formylglycine-generating enzyme required for sulfatase activity/tRNA A-37 threonylcarbamoyl transferase component Bud32